LSVTGSLKISQEVKRNKWHFLDYEVFRADRKVDAVECLRQALQPCGFCDLAGHRPEGFPRILGGRRISPTFDVTGVVMAASAHAASAAKFFVHADNAELDVAEQDLRRKLVAEIEDLPDFRTISDAADLANVYRNALPRITSLYPGPAVPEAGPIASLIIVMKESLRRYDLDLQLGLTKGKLTEDESFYVSSLD
jgi:hypothetical protein